MLSQSGTDFSHERLSLKKKKKKNFTSSRTTRTGTWQLRKAHLVEQLSLSQTIYWCYRCQPASAKGRKVCSKCIDSFLRFNSTGLVAAAVAEVDCSVSPAPEKLQLNPTCHFMALAAGPFCTAGQAVTTAQLFP